MKTENHKNFTVLKTFAVVHKDFTEIELKVEQLKNPDEKQGIYYRFEGTNSVPISGNTFFKIIGSKFKIVA